MGTGIVLAAPLGVVVKLLCLLTLQPTGLGVLAHTRLFSPFSLLPVGPRSLSP